MLVRSAGHSPIRRVRARSSVSLDRPLPCEGRLRFGAGFADGFAGAKKTPEGATYRPTGLAVGPDGSLYVSDDVKGRIYRIVYTGDPPAQHPRALHVRAFLLLRARSLHRPRGYRRMTPKTFPFPKDRRQRWLLWVLAFTTVELAARVVLVATV